MSKEGKFTEIKNKFRTLIRENIRSNNFLSMEYLMPYNELVNRDRNKLKFYKYCNAEYYAIRNIEKSTLAFKKCSEFNDPFEGISLVKSEKEKEDLAIIRNSAVVTCVSEEKKDLLMFAHYADSFKGFCVEYDLNLLDENVYNRIMPYFFPVIYAKTPEYLKFKKILRNRISDYINGIEELNKISGEKRSRLDDIISYFLHKAEIWDYEKEWRFIVPISQYENVFNIRDNMDRKVILFEKFDCISAIYLGLNMSEDKKEHIAEIVMRLNQNRGEKPKIKLYETSLADDQYELVKNDYIFDDDKMNL